MKQTRWFFLYFFLHFLSFSISAENTIFIPCTVETSCTWAAPLNFQASQVTPTSITFIWNHPTQGLPPKGYSIKIIETNTGALIDSVGMNGTTKTFSGLAMGTYYTAEIRSICSDGQVSDYFARTNTPTIILDEIVNSLCSEPPVTADPVGNLLNSVISNANTSDYVYWLPNTNNDQYQFYYFRVSDVGSNTFVVKFIIYRENNETKFHFKRKFSQTWKATLDTVYKSVKLFKGNTLRANIYIEQDGFLVQKNGISGSFSIKADLVGSCTSYGNLQVILDNDIPFNDDSSEVEVEKISDSWLWEIFPNPANETIMVKCESQNLEIHKIIISNHFGNIINEVSYSLNNKLELFTTSIDINDLPTGLYNLSLLTKNGISIKKFIKI